MTASAGVVKWFGGYNSAKNAENKFGFVESIDGFDVFLHESGWLGQGRPSAGQLIHFHLEDHKGKWVATSANDLDELPLDELIGLMTQKNGQSHVAAYIKIREIIASCISRKLSTRTRWQTERIIDLMGLDELLSMLSDKQDWSKNIEFLATNGHISPLKDIDWLSLPAEYIAKNVEEAANHLQSIDNSEAARLFNSSLGKLPPDLKLFGLLAGYLGKYARGRDKELESINEYVKDIYSGKDFPPDYIKTKIRSLAHLDGGIMMHPVIGPTFSYYQFKKYLYEKDLKFVNLYERTESLRSRADIFILKEIFSLVLAGNTLDNVYDLFMASLWEAIISEKINPEQDIGEILELFPACSTLENPYQKSPKLSCEAVYWKKQEIYLCRGKSCHYPKVIPNTGKNYTEFNIYDWFAHYDINYLHSAEPTEQDFPIKVAGYLNRLREIFKVIHCRCCSSLMIPDLRYARVEYMAVENGKVVKKDMAPAYRLTVFKCPNPNCVEFRKGHYINHCMGQGCYDIIDSRDSSLKCDAGRYICRSCASCCGDHAKSNPIGLCPDCAAPLKLYESNTYDALRNRYNRFVKCSGTNCSFTIESDDLVKRFYLPSCMPLNRQRQ